MTKKDNKSIENQRVNYIVDNWTTSTQNPSDHFKDMLNNVGISISNINNILALGKLNDHHDFEIHCNNNKVFKIEHKGFASDDSKYDPHRPWNDYPQIINGSVACLPSIRNKYCKEWHNQLPILKTILKINVPIPSYNEFCKDAAMGSHKTVWGQHLYDMVKKEKAKRKVLNNYTQAFTKNFWENIEKNDPDFKNSFKKELFNEINQTLNNKDLWLNAYYNSTKDIEPTSIKLSIVPKLLELRIGKVSTGLSGPEVEYRLSSSPNKWYKGEARLRWQNRNGIANVSWKIK
jgi:hypothetical protein